MHTPLRHYLIRFYLNDNRIFFRFKSTSGVCENIQLPSCVKNNKIKSTGPAVVLSSRPGTRIRDYHTRWLLFRLLIVYNGRILENSFRLYISLKSLRQVQRIKYSTGLI